MGSVTDWIAGAPLWLQIPIVMLCALALCSVGAVVLLRMIDVMAAVARHCVLVIAHRLMPAKRFEPESEPEEPHLGESSAPGGVRGLQESEREADRA